MRFRILVLCAAAAMLPLGAVQAPTPTSTPQTAPAPTKKMTKKQKKAAAAAAATPASRPAAPAPAVATAPSRQASQPAVAPVAGGFVGNKDSKIVHRADCKMAAKISAAHRVTFASASDAKAQGYRACKVCKPF